MSQEPVVYQKAPFAVEVEEGKTYYWCRCGRSKNQPYCDGAHQGTDFQPLAYTAEKSDTVYLCGCKKTGDEPFCDGTHHSL